jgi:hypothetical protein
MLVHRQTFLVKPLKQQELSELCKEGFTMNPAPHGSRIFTNYIGPGDTVVVDMEYENLTEYTDWWDKWWSLPETPAFMEKWLELVESGGSDAFWNVVE